jgi:hypothetical protein
METFDLETFMEHVAGMACENGSLYKNRQKDRDELLEFMECNSWFGASNTKEGKTYVSMNDACRNALGIWLRLYKKGDDEKVTVLMEVMRARYPRTADRLTDFFKGKSQDKNQWMLIDFMLGRLSKELDEYTDEEIETLKAKGLYNEAIYRPEEKPEGEGDDDGISVDNERPDVQIDKETGYAIDPNTGEFLDPNTGYPINPSSSDLSDLEKPAEGEAEGSQTTN